MCFTPERKRPESERKVSDTRTRAGVTREKRKGALLLCRKMELPAAGEHVFAVESIEKKRSRKVGTQRAEGRFHTHAHGFYHVFLLNARRTACFSFLSVFVG